jgi:hypothetical protein
MCTLSSVLGLVISVTGLLPKNGNCMSTNPAFMITSRLTSVTSVKRLLAEIRIYKNM